MVRGRENLQEAEIDSKLSLARAMCCEYYVPMEILTAVLDFCHA